MTSGVDVAKSGAALLLFALVGLLYVHYLVPRLNRAIGFPAWHEVKWVKRLNYGGLFLVGGIGSVVTVVGLIAWAAGWSFG